MPIVVEESSKETRLPNGFSDMWITYDDIP